MDWTEAHRPATLADLVGNGPAVAALRKWADAWVSGVPKKRAVVLSGPPGVGKTTAALALARDMGWAVIELNASDARNAEAIKRVATAGALHQTFGDDGSFGASGEGKRKLIILDEADNLYERMSGENAAGGKTGATGTDLSDRGGKAQIIDTIRRTQQPIVLIVNDLYGLTRGSGSALSGLAETIKFTRVHTRSIPKALGEIARKEGVRVEPAVLEAIATKAEGDLRAAVRDLEALCAGRTEVRVADLHGIGARDTTGTVFDMVRHVLKGRDGNRLRREALDLDATPEDIVMWVDENLPKEYKHPEDLVRGYEALSRADIFLGRARRTQNYRMWAYASDMATVGVMAARQHEYKGFQPFGFPQWLSKMSRSRGVRGVQNEITGHLGARLHMSKRKARLFQLEPFRALFRSDEEFAAVQTAQLELADDEVAMLLGEKANSKQVKTIREKADAMKAAPSDEGLRWGRRAPRGRDAEDPADDTDAGEGDGGQEGMDDGPDRDASDAARPKPGQGQAKLF